MAKVILTDRTLKAIKAKPGKRYARMDAVIAGFGIRVSEKGKKTFVLRTRYPNGKGNNASWRALGEYPAMTLVDAREKAAAWLKLVKQHTDPAEIEERERQAAQRKRANTFAAVVEDFIDLAVIGPDPAKPKQRRGGKVAREMRQFFVPLWGDRPITEIRREDVQSAIKGIRDYGTNGMLATYGIKGDHAAKRKGAPGQARNLLGNLKTCFAWAIAQNEYAIETSPCRDIKAKDLVGAKKSRARALNENEIVAFWRATQHLEYPFRPIYRMLLLSGLRLNEVADASRSEFDLKRREWTIPASRMKGTDETAHDHLIPLTDEMQAILDELPRLERGDYLFSLTFGAKPIWVGDKIKKTLDKLMLAELRDMARMRGEDPARVVLAPWVNHDLRRTMRTELSRLRVDHDVKEALLAHAKPGMAAKYDVYDLAKEKRDALEKWEAAMRAIVSPPPASAGS